MNPVAAALEAAFVGDFRTGTILSATTTVVSLGAGEAVPFVPGDPIWVEVLGTAATLKRRVFTVQEKGPGDDDLTIWPPMPVAPQAGDKVHGGVREFVLYNNSTDTGIYYREPPDADPGEAAAKAGAFRCLLFYGKNNSPNRALASETARFRVGILGMNEWMIDGCSRALVMLLDQDPAKLTVGGFTVHTLSVFDDQTVDRDEENWKERSLDIEVGYTRVGG